MSDLGVNGLQNKRVVMVSLIPDAGHLKSLLLILKNLNTAGADVHVIVPDEAEFQVRAFGFSYELIGQVVPEDGHRFLQTLSRSGRWKHVFFSHLEAQNRYFLELTYRGLQLMPLVLDKLRSDRCDAILCDPHIFLDEYCSLATVLNAPLFVHEATGTLYRLQDRRIHREDDTKISKVIERWALRHMPAWHYRFNKIFRRSQFKAWREMNRKITEQRCSYSKADENAIYRITTGTANIENKYIFNGSQQADDFFRFGSLDPCLDWGSGYEVMDWLQACEDSSVVYISFGTMVSPPDKLLFRIVSHFRSLGKRILVASGSSPVKAVSDYGDSVLWMPWAPQTAVLASPKVIAFVSHMGATSFREALWFGKPVLGIPLLWDHFYCAWAAEVLGVGRVIQHQRITDRLLHELISDVLNNVEFITNARKLSKELRAEGGDEKIARFISNVLVSIDGFTEQSGL